MSVKRNHETRTLTINQPKYLEGVLKRFGMQECKPVSTPLEPGKKFESLSEKETPINVQAYQMVIVCLTYATTATRPDLASAVGILSKFMSRPGKELSEFYDISKETLNYGLMFVADGENPVLNGYSDADLGRRFRNSTLNIGICISNTRKYMQLVGAVKTVVCLEVNDRSGVYCFKQCMSRRSLATKIIVRY